MMSGAWSVVTFTFCKKSPPPPVLTKLTTVPLTMPPLANASPSGAVAVLAPTIAAGFSADQSGLQQCHLLRDDAVLIFRRHAHRLHRQQQAVIRNNGGLLAECLQGRLWPRDLRRPIRVHQT